MTDGGIGTPGPAQGGFQKILSRILSFDQLIGSSLLRILYYVGLAGIVLWTVVILLAGLAAAADSPVALLVALLSAVLVLVVGTLFWRFTCELWMVIFKIHDRLGEIRDRLPPKA